MKEPREREKEAKAVIKAHGFQHHAADDHKGSPTTRSENLHSATITKAPAAVYTTLLCAFKGERTADANVICSQYSLTSSASAQYNFHPSHGERAVAANVNEVASHNPEEMETKRISRAATKCIFSSLAGGAVHVVYIKV